MAVIAGIDEAGYGPVLGPLVVTAVAFEVPDDRAGASLWELLAAGVGRTAARRGGRLAIGDSKKLYSRRTGRSVEHLERATLAALGSLPERRRCATLGDLLAATAPAARGALRGYPWYADAPLELPRCIGATDRDLATNALSATMRRAGVRLLTVRCEPVPVGEFNRLVTATDNKTTMLLSITGRLLHHVWDLIDGSSGAIRVDRQGGRMRYRPYLRDLFPRCRLKVLDEGDGRSAYRLVDDRRAAEVSFGVCADAEHLPTALASMVSKYVRELFMEQFNAFWTRRVSGVAPTAGYYVDGRRFYGAIAPTIRELGIDERRVYRCR
ncbi:MAG: hypothetical protein ACOC8F_07700 [Planctomycetota bacterium]